MSNIPGQSIIDLTEKQIIIDGSQKTGAEPIPLMVPVISEIPTIIVETPLPISTESVPVDGVENILKISIIKPLEKLTFGTQRYITVNGTPASGKSTELERVRRFVAQFQKKYKLKSVNVTLADTDLILGPLWKQTMSPKLSSTQSQDLFLSQVHKIFYEYFSTQPADALIICFGVSDNVSFSPNGDSIMYVMPNIPWMNTFFINIDFKQLLKQRFRRDIKMVVNNAASEKALCDPDSNETLVWNKEMILNEYTTDRHVYISRCQYEHLTADEIFSRITDIINLSVPLSKRLKTMPEKKRKKTTSTTSTKK